MKNEHMVQGILLDLDGTLVDSNDAHAMAWKDALDDLGLRTSFLEIRRCIGMGSDRLLPKLAGVEKGSIRGKEVSDLRAQIFRNEYFPQIKAFPYSRELIQRMHESRLKIGVFSSSDREEVESMLKKIGIEDYIEFCVSGSDVEASKPATDGVRVALDRFQLEPSDILLLGDTPYDIEAGAQIGVKTVALRTGGWSDRDLKGAMVIYDNPQDAYIQFDSAPWSRRMIQTAA
jgi:HAD superfamily hydrolase (TIGR01509 family)